MDVQQYSRKEERLKQSLLKFRDNCKKITDPPGFEPGPEAPEASILSRLYYESTSPLISFNPASYAINAMILEHSSENWE